MGEGIKRTPAYETPLNKHDLDKWRKEFWGKLLRQCLQTINKLRIVTFGELWQRVLHLLPKEFGIYSTQSGILWQTL